MLAVGQRQTRGALMFYTLIATTFLYSKPTKAYRWYRVQVKNINSIEFGFNTRDIISERNVLPYSNQSTASDLSRCIIKYTTYSVD